MFHFQNVAVRQALSVAVFVCVGILSVIVRVESQTNDICVDVNDGCVCTRPGIGRIDLRKFALSNGSARFDNVKGKDGVFYSYNPCYSFSEVDSLHKPVVQCQGVAICARNGTKYNGTAVQKGAKFDFDSTRQELFVQYPNPEFPQRPTRMYLGCQYQAEFRPAGPQEMYLYSQCVCPGGCPDPPSLSPGSILLIIFFTVMSAYLVVGALANKAINGAVGVEIIPNYSFWSDLPALVKDGYLFFLSPCLGDQVRYNNIYQNI